MPIDGEVRTRSCGDLEVAPQDRRPQARLDLLQDNALAPTVAQHRSSTGRPDVCHPCRSFTEHRDEVPLVLMVCDDHRKRPSCRFAK
jgi:hypothetical protein